MEGLEVFSAEELKVIQEFFDVLAKRTRKTQKISNKRKITIIESWKKYDPKAVISALKVYISMKATSTQNEKYVLGIIRNKHKELGGIAYDRNSRSDEQSKTGSQERQEMLTKEQDSDSLLLKEALRKNNIANSKKCPFGICDGTGLIYDKEKNGHYKCDCAKLEIKEQKLKFASIPEEFKDFKVGEFDTEIYTKVESRENAVFVKNIAIEYVKKFDKMQSLGKGLYFYSRLRGTGKTRLAASVGNAIIKTYLKSVRFITTSNLLNSIKSTFENSSSFGDTYTTL